MNTTGLRRFPWAALGLGLQIYASEVEPNALPASSLVRYGLLLVAAVLPLVLVPMRSAVLPDLLRRSPLSWLSAYLAWTLLSAVWSVDPAHSLQPALWILSVTLFSTWYVSIHGFTSFRRVAATSLTMFLASCWVNQAAQAPGQRLQGISVAPTNVGFLGGITVILGASLVRGTAGGRRDRAIGVAAITIGLSSVVWSSTRTIMIGLVLIGAAAGMRRTGRSGALRASVILLAAVLAFIIGASGDLLVVSHTPDGTDFATSRGGVIVLSHEPGSSEYTTGTGRTKVWEQTFRLVRQRPIAGWGSGSTERIYREVAASGRLSWLAFGAHDGPLGILLAAGFVGFGLFATACVAYLRTSRRARDTTRSALLTLLAISSIGESLFDTGHLAHILVGACFAAAANDAALVRPFGAAMRRSRAAGAPVEHALVGA